MLDKCPKCREKALTWEENGMRFCDWDCRCHDEECTPEELGDCCDKTESKE